MEFIIGIDPGFTGGIAFFNPELVILYHTPVVSIEYIKTVRGKRKPAKRSEMVLEYAIEIIRETEKSGENTILCAYLEHVAAMKKENVTQGVTSTFRFGQNFGQWQGILAGLGIETVLVRPQTWKRKYDLIGAEKKDSLELARSYFPEHVDSFRRKTKDDGVAEAALLAKYGWNERHG